MSSRSIADGGEWRYGINDGYTRHEFELDPYRRRISITGGEFYNREFEPQISGSHSLDAIDELADALKALVARGRGGKP